jgi:Ser/Thr protein kinase RdoA (MazF antagonist)
MTNEYAPEIVDDLCAMARAALPAYALPATTEITLLNLSENATFVLRAPRETRILRIHRVGYSWPEEIRAELAWIEALRAARIVETAPPIAAANGETVLTLSSPAGHAPRHAVAFAFLPGKEPDPAGDIAAWFTKLGELTARMHAHAKAWPRPAGFQRKTWDVPAMVGPDAHWGPWRAGIGLTERGAAVIERALARVTNTLGAYGTSPDRFGLIHADLRLANLLVDGEQLRVIDFDDCGFSWFLYDFAAAISFIEHEPIIPALRAAWVEGYRAAAPLSAEDDALLPSFVMLRRVMLTAWLASHAEVPLAQSIGASYTQGTIALAEAYLAGRLLTDI